MLALWLTDRLATSVPHGKQTLLINNNSIKNKTKTKNTEPKKTLTKQNCKPMKTRNIESKTVSGTIYVT